MSYDPPRHHRRSIRLSGWDYAHPGWYYVTILVKDRECHFGHVVNDTMELSALGLVADACWRQIPLHHVGVGLDEHIVMPNHVHGIVIINEKQHMDVNGRDVQLNVPTGKIIALNATSTGEYDKRRGTNKPMSPVKGSLSVIIRTFKAAVTTWAHGNGYGDFAWQGRFHDHIIRNEEELHRIREYIRNNPLDWALDNENSENDPIRSK